MELEELLQLLDLDSPDEFAYFEHFADLIECDDYIEYEDFFEVLSRAEAHTLKELSENYFEDILTNLPDNVVDIYTLLVSIQKCLMGLASGVDSREGRRAYVDELYRFRNWYTLDSVVSCTPANTGISKEVPLLEAISLCRMEKLNEGSYDYDFSQALDYPLEEYAVSLGAAEVRTDYEDDENGDEAQEYERHHSCDCDTDHAQMEEAYTMGLVDRYNPVIDGEYDDEDMDLIQP